MASNTVAERKRRPNLPINKIDEGDTLCIQLSGIIDCVLVASRHAGNLRDESLANACWAALGYIEKLQRIIGARQPFEEEGA